MPIDWYEEVSHDTPLTQGDLIFNCPVIGWKEAEPALAGKELSETLKAHTEAVAVDVGVMTQACDLKFDKVRNVILCPHFRIDAYRKAWETDMKARDQNPSNKAWNSHASDICDGFLWNLSILNAGKVETLSTERIVDFHEVYSVPRTFIESFLSQRDEPRLRLRPPYREHLSQAFARFFMRVGLPVPVTLKT
jgi:hypothetical protein